MTEFRPRFFHSDAEIEHLGEGLLARTLSRDEWTHEAHLAATTYLLLRRPDVDLDRELPTIIRRFNKSVGGVNSETEGYHETITRVFLHGVRLFLAEADPKEPLHGIPRKPAPSRMPAERSKAPPTFRASTKRRSSAAPLTFRNC